MITKMNYLFGVILLLFGIPTLAEASNFAMKPSADSASSKVEIFTFTSNGKAIKGKIYLPPSFNANNHLAAIYLIDFTEQHFKLATDEFEKVIDGVNQVDGFNALVVSLDGIPDVDAESEKFEEHYSIFKDMTNYVDSFYTKNSSRTFIGKGSESGVVLMALFLENQENTIFDNYIVTDPSSKYSSAIIELIEKNNFPKGKSNKKLHFSFSTSNDRELCTKLINLFSEAQYKWLQFESVEYSKSNYENTYPISYAAGIKYVFSE